MSKVINFDFVNVSPKANPGTGIGTNYLIRRSFRWPERYKRPVEICLQYLLIPQGNLKGSLVKIKPQRFTDIHHLLLFLEWIPLYH